MVDIISRREGPRKEDQRIKQLVDKNRSTITRLADHLSGGTYSASKRPLQAPSVSDATIRHVVGAAPPPAEVLYHVRISVNGRVVIIDQNSGRQLHYVGEIRGRDGEARFVLATAANGFAARLDESLAAKLHALDQQSLNKSYTEEHLAKAIEEQLGLV